MQAHGRHTTRYIAGKHKAGGAERQAHGKGESRHTTHRLADSQQADAEACHRWTRRHTSTSTRTKLPAPAAPPSMCASPSACLQVKRIDAPAAVPPPSTSPKGPALPPPAATAATAAAASSAAPAPAPVHAAPTTAPTVPAFLPNMSFPPHMSLAQRAALAGKLVLRLLTGLTCAQHVCASDGVEHVPVSRRGACRRAGPAKGLC